MDASHSDPGLVPPSLVRPARGSHSSPVSIPTTPITGSHKKKVRTPGSSGRRHRKSQRALMKQSDHHGDDEIPAIVRDLFPDLTGGIRRMPVSFPDLDRLFSAPMDIVGSETVAEFKSNPNDATVAKRTFVSLLERIDSAIESTPVLTSLSLFNADSAPSLALTPGEMEAVRTLSKIVTKFISRIPDASSLRFGQDYVEVYNLFEHFFDHLTGDYLVPRIEYVRYVYRLEEISSRVGFGSMQILLGVCWWFFSDTLPLEIARDHTGVTVVELKKLKGIIKQNEASTDMYPGVLNNLILGVFEDRGRLQRKKKLFEVIDVVDEQAKDWGNRKQLGTDGGFRPGTYEPLYFLRHISMLAAAGRPIESPLTKILTDTVEIQQTTPSEQKPLAIVRIRHHPNRPTNFIDWPREVLDWILNVRYSSNPKIPTDMKDKFVCALLHSYWNELALEDEIVIVTKQHLMDLRRELMGKLVMLFMTLNQNQLQELDKVRHFADKVETELFYAGTIRSEDDRHHWTQFTDIEDLEEEFREVNQMYDRLVVKKMVRQEAPVIVDPSFG